MFLGINMFWSLLKAHLNPCLVAKMNLNWVQNIFMKVNIISSVLQAFCCPHPLSSTDCKFHWLSRLWMWFYLHCRSWLGLSGLKGRLQKVEAITGPQFPYLLIRFWTATPFYNPDMVLVVEGTIGWINRIQEISGFNNSWLLVSDLWSGLYYLHSPDCSRCLGLSCLKGGFHYPLDNIQLSHEEEVNSGGYIPRCEASRYISTALPLPW